MSRASRAAVESPLRGPTTGFRHRDCYSRPMNWLMLLGLAVVVAALAAVTGIKPRETRPVAHTRMMGVARVVLGMVAVFLAYLAFRGRTG